MESSPESKRSASVEALAAASACLLMPVRLAPAFDTNGPTTPAFPNSLVFGVGSDFLLDESDRHRVAIQFSVTRLDGGDDDEDGVQNPKGGEENEADQDEAKDGGDDVVDEHRDLEIERFFAVRIDFGRVVALGQPDNERPEQVAGEMKKNAEQGAGVTKRVPGADVGEGGSADR